MTKAVFLDRDGTISVEVGYIDSVENFKLYPHSAQALADLQSLGFKLVIITNQSGVARGLFPESRVKEMHNRMCSLLSESGVRIDGIYYCPHLSEGTVAEYAYECSCRKPEIGMIVQAAEELDLDLDASIFIGDKLTDIDCGRNAGLKTVLVRTGYGKDAETNLGERSQDEQPDVIVDTVRDVVEWIINEAL